MPGCFDAPAAPIGSPPPPATPGHGLRLLCVSVRGNHGYLLGNPTMHPVDIEPATVSATVPAVVPAAAGTRFADLDEIKRYVSTELRGLSAIGQVRVIDDDGAVVMDGFHAGHSERWTWRPPSAPSRSAARPAARS